MLKTLHYTDTDSSLKESFILLVAAKALKTLGEYNRSSLETSCANTFGGEASPEAHQSNSIIETVEEGATRFEITLKGFRGSDLSPNNV